MERMSAGARNDATRWHYGSNRYDPVNSWCNRYILICTPISSAVGVYVAVCGLFCHCSINNGHVINVCLNILNCSTATIIQYFQS